MISERNDGADGSQAELADLHARLRELKAEFDAAHEYGMAGLTEGNYQAFAQAVERETAIVQEHGKLLRKIRHLRFPEGKPSG